MVMEGGFTAPAIKQEVDPKQEKVKSIVDGFAGFLQGKNLPNTLDTMGQYLDSLGLSKDEYFDAFSAVSDKRHEVLTIEANSSQEKMNKITEGYVAFVEKSGVANNVAAIGQYMDSINVSLEDEFAVFTALSNKKQEMLNTLK